LLDLRLFASHLSRDAVIAVAKTHHHVWHRTVITKSIAHLPTSALLLQSAQVPLCLLSCQGPEWCPVVLLLLLLSCLPLCPAVWLLQWHRHHLRLQVLCV
jgi:hypothetical protein